MRLKEKRAKGLARSHLELDIVVFLSVNDCRSSIALDNTGRGADLIIISLASYPVRIPNFAPHALFSLYSKSSPHKILLYLAQEEFPHSEQDLPPKYLGFQKTRLGN